MPRRALVATCAAMIAASAVGCEDELNFTTGRQEVFHGAVLDDDFLVARPDTAEHVLAAGTTMEMRLNMRTLDTDPGVVATSDGLFEAAHLVMLPEITCDRLSAFELEGGFRRSFIFLAPVSDPAFAGTDAVLFVSLGQSEDKVEVRVLIGAGERRRAFGVFHLAREVVEEPVE
jgi:hypothetical protein